MVASNHEVNNDSVTLPLHYARAGEGPTVVLVHGYLGGSEQWKAEMESLSANFDVIAIDLPGFGKSRNVAPQSSIEGFARSVIQCLDSLGVSQFDLLGHSMGGMIVQDVVRIVPDRVRKLVLYATGALGSLPGRFETLERSRERLREEGLEATGRRISATWLREYEQSPAAGQLAELALQANEDGALAALWAMETWDGREAVRHIKQKTLILWGELDRTYSWEQTAYFWREISGSSLAVVPNCSHAVHLDNPALFFLLLSDFLRPSVSDKM